MIRGLLLLFLLGVGSVGAAEITVQTYNVENLFDAEDDPGKDDGTYLPKAKKDEAHRRTCNRISNRHWKKQCLEYDWTPAVVKEKIRRLKGVIEHRWKTGPDVLILQEVENDRVLAQLQKALGHYPHRFLLEGKDKRGIDVAVLSRLPAAGNPQLKTLRFSKKFAKRVGDTRPILAVPLKTAKGVLTVLGVHFPAPFHPQGMRKEAFEQLNAFAEEQVKRGHSVLAAGDFNVTNLEDSALYRGLAAPAWFVSHLEGCHACLGTNYYAPKKSWSFLDAILVHRDSPHWKVLPDSVERITEAPEQTRKGAPYRFELKGSQVEGISDHYPMSLVLTEKTSGE